MPKYCVTMERTSRIAHRLKADNDADAERMAARMQDNMKPSDYEGGDCEEDYSLCAEDGREIVAWD